MRVLLRIAVFLGLLGAAVSASGTAAGQEGGEEQFIDPEGTEAFVHLLGQAGSKALGDMAALKEAEPKRTLVVLFGPPTRWRQVQQAVGGWRRFLDGGGALLVASDHADDGVLRELGITITGQEVKQIPQFAYQGHWDHIPLIRLVGPHPLFRGLRQPLAALRPSPVRLEDGPYRWLGGFGKGSMAQDTGRHVGGQAFVVGSPWDAPPGGRVLVLGGHGLFMNSMIVRPDCDNWGFAANAVRWLREGPEGARTQVFLMDSRGVLPTLDIPLGTPIPPLVPPIEALNSLIKGLEEDRILQRYLYEYFGREGVLQPWLLGALVFVVVFGLRRLWKAQFRQDHGAVLHVGLPVPVPPALPLAHQREAALMVRGDFREPARLLVRDWFHRRCGVDPESWGPQVTPVPRFRSDLGFFARLRAARTWRWLLMLAGKDFQGKVTKRNFAALNRGLKEMESGWGEG